MRIRYTKSDQAPKLLETSILLSVNGVTAASSEAEKLAAIAKLQDDTETYTNTETNVFLEQLANKVLLQVLFKRMQFKDPITRNFFSEGISYSAAKEVIDNQLLTSVDYDPEKRFPDKQNKASVLNTILFTAAKKLLTNTVQIIGVKAAFASEQAYGEWLAKQTDLLQESLQVELFTQLSPIIQTGVKNIINLNASFDTWDKVFVEINRISKTMAEIPSKKYNCGFADPTDPVNAKKTRVQITSRENLLVISSPDVVNALEGEVSTVKFHNAYFDIKKYGGTISLDMPNTEIMLVQKSAFTGYFRVNQVASQFWAGNMTIEYFLHYWYTFGIVPWATGVKFILTAAPADQPETTEIVETVNLDETPKEGKGSTKKDEKEPW